MIWFLNILVQLGDWATRKIRSAEDRAWLRDRLPVGTVVKVKCKGCVQFIGGDGPQVIVGYSSLESKEYEVANKLTRRETYCRRDCFIVMYNHTFLQVHNVYGVELIEVYEAGKLISSIAKDGVEHVQR